jgi:hypothetical protein
MIMDISIEAAIFSFDEKFLKVSDAAFQMLT